MTDHLNQILISDTWFVDVVRGANLLIATVTAAMLLKLYVDKEVKWVNALILLGFVSLLGNVAYAQSINIWTGAGDLVLVNVTVLASVTAILVGTLKVMKIRWPWDD